MTNADTATATVRVKQPVVMHKAIGGFTLDAGNPGGLPAVDENRRAVGIGEYRDVLTAMIGRLSKEDLSPTLISDGYERTYHVLRRAMQRCHPLLHGVTDRELADSQRSAHATLEEDLASLLNWARSVGETDRKLYQSIDALACADIVVCGTGGFAHYVHQLFRPPGARSATVQSATSVTAGAATRP